MNILVLHGPNLNLLGSREPEVYGSATLDDVNKELNRLTKQLGASVDIIQSNAEHVLVDTIQQAKGKYQFIIINPAAFTHTSVALRDAFAAVAIPFIEIHISNVHSREEFRQHSYLSDLAVGVITGLGTAGYRYALQAAVKFLESN